jgi:hypothetical protein
MRTGIALNALAVGLAAARPSLLQPRQDINFDLVDLTPDPSRAADDSTAYNPTSALAAVVAEITNDPLPQTPQGKRRDIQQRDIIVKTADGYSDNLSLGNAAINAPKDCAGADTYMGAKIFTTGPFDTTLCAAACSAQSAYNLRHPPAGGKAQTCQFYNTYTMYKNNVYQGKG